MSFIGTITALAFHPSLDICISGSSDGYFKKWEPEKYKKPTQNEGKLNLVRKKSTKKALPNDLKSVTSSIIGFFGAPLCLVGPSPEGLSGSGLDPVFFWGFSCF